MKKLILATSDTTTPLESGYHLDESGKDGSYQITKLRPYDDADYYWATTKAAEENETWYIVKNGRIVKEISSHDEDEYEIVELLEELNSSIKPRILHN